MSQEIGQREVVLHPLTGEVLELDATPTEELGRFLYEIRDLESRLREIKSLANREILSRQDRNAEWTTRAGEYVLKGASPSSTSTEEFDGLALRSDLCELVDSGVLSIEAVDAAVQTVIIYKARKVGVNALRKLGGVVAETVDQHAKSVEKPRYVTVSRV
jgi:hypothetical protein